MFILLPSLLRLPIKKCLHFSPIRFANTVSNLPLILLPLLNLLLLRPYIASVNPLIIWPHSMLALNGIASAYYHATLSLFGQLVDELLIVWLVILCAIAYLPTLNTSVPQRLRSHVFVIFTNFGIIPSPPPFLQSIPSFCVAFHVGPGFGPLLPEAPFECLCPDDLLSTWHCGRLC
jgi:hypothetical protein